MLKAVLVMGCLLASACAARVPLQVAPSPIALVPTLSIAVVSDTRECHAVADRLTEHLRSANLEVRPDSAARVTVFACNKSWSTHRAHEIEGRGQAISALSVNGQTTAHLVGAAGHLQSVPDALPSTVRSRRRVTRSIDDRIARDIAEQLAPEPIPIRRRVYANTPAGSARELYNLAVHAEREGRLRDALWWAERANERRPSNLRARYVEELARRVSRTGTTPL